MFSFPVNFGMVLPYIGISVKSSAIWIKFPVFLNNAMVKLESAEISVHVK